jgi:hypothetical protein
MILNLSFLFNCILYLLTSLLITILPFCTQQKIKSHIFHFLILILWLIYLFFNNWLLCHSVLVFYIWFSVPLLKLWTILHFFYSFMRRIFVYRFIRILIHRIYIRIRLMLLSYWLIIQLSSESCLFFCDLIIFEELIEIQIIFIWLNVNSM